MLHQCTTQARQINSVVSNLHRLRGPAPSHSPQHGRSIIRTPRNQHLCTPHRRVALNTRDAPLSTGREKDQPHTVPRPFPAQPVAGATGRERRQWRP
ncbi:hypothetical protein LSAT2_029257 [Lamellibrachia satsuma]|nr:hypothetical protein LSAT2_029257 [Lamellibrachia satsuma]